MNTQPCHHTAIYHHFPELSTSIYVIYAYFEKETPWTAFWILRLHPAEYGAVIELLMLVEHLRFKFFFKLRFNPIPIRLSILLPNVASSYTSEVIFF